MAGTGHLVLLSGEPGIGKTSLAQETVADAASHGMPSFWGRCWERGAPPYWPWIQVLRALLLNWRERRASGPSAEVTTWLTQIAKMVGELEPVLADLGFGRPSHEALPSAPQVPPAADPERFRLFDAVSGFLGHMARTTPFAIVVDDLQAADADSLQLLNFVARDLVNEPLLIIATFRPEDLQTRLGIPALISEIAREGKTLSLHGLTSSEIGEFVHGKTGAIANAALTASLQDRSAGNPLFLEQMSRLAAELARSGDPDGAWDSIPRDSITVIERRLAPLSDRARGVLRVASAMTDEIDVSVLSRVCEATGEALNSAMDEALNCGLIGKLKDRPGRYCFIHGLVAEALRSTMTSSELARIHWSIASAIEQLYPGETGELSQRLAFHYVEALPVGPAEKAVNYSRRAAEAARARLAYAEAARLYRLAIRALSAVENARPTVECELLLGLGETQERDGDHPGARDSFRRALGASKSLNATTLSARAILGVANSSPGVGSADEGLIVELEQAAAALGPSDQGLRALVLANLSRELFWSNRREQAFANSREAVDLAKGAGDQSVLLTTLWYKYWVLWGPEDADQRLADATELVRLAEQCGDADLLMSSRGFRISALLELGDIDALVAEVKACARTSASIGSPAGTVERFRIMLALLEGDFDKAERMGSDLLAIGQRRSDPVLLITYAGQYSQLRGEQGRLDELEPLLRASAAQNPGFITTRCGLAFLYARARRRTEARAEFEFVATDNFARVRRDWNWIGSMALLSAVANFLSDKPRSAALYRMLEPFANRCATLGWGDVYYGSVAHYLGLLATTMGEYDRAQFHFESGLRISLKMGARPSLARTQCGYCAMLLARGDSRDRERALDLAGEARATAETLGMVSLVAEADALLAEVARSVWNMTPSHESRNPTKHGLTVTDSGSVLATFVFTDIVGSTEKAAQMGDRRWAARLIEYYSTVRGHLQRFHGLEVNTAGDGFLAAFEAPVAAVRCANSIRDALSDIGLEVRLGVHAGECERVGDDFTGLAVHIGARVAATAKAGEVLVSSTVKDLVIGSELGFRDYGTYQLKGVPGEWRLYLATQI